MRIKKSGHAIYLYRYGGFDKASNRTFEVKIGSLPVETVPVIGTDLDPSLVDNNIPIELWEALTVVEQRTLIDYLTLQREQRLRGQLITLSTDLPLFAGQIRPDLVDRDLADGLHDGLTTLLASLKKAGYLNPRQKRTPRGPRPSAQPSTDSRPEAIAASSSN